MHVSVDTGWGQRSYGSCDVSTELLANTVEFVTEPPGPLPDPSPSGRTYSQVRKVRLGDVRPDGKLRLDALVRYAQDVSNDDTTDAELLDDLAWVVRRTTVDVIVDAVFGETLTFVTFCSGIGRRWAERRLHITGDRGARLEVSTLWIHLDPDNGRPRPLSTQFLDLYAEAAQGRTVRARLEHPDPPASAERRSWPVRAVDFDLFHHMNNAAYWAVVEELFAESGVESAGKRIRLEYGHGVDRGLPVTLLLDREIGESTSPTTMVWWCTGDADTVAASGQISQFPMDWYRGPLV